MKKKKVWHVCILSSYTGDVKEIIATYYNRGHAISFLKGLESKSWMARSEMCYGLRKG